MCLTDRSQFPLVMVWIGSTTDEKKGSYELHQGRREGRSGGLPASSFRGSYPIGGRKGMPKHPFGVPNRWGSSSHSSKRVQDFCTTLSEPHWLQSVLEKRGGKKSEEEAASGLNLHI
ncbi:Hypothetical protein FKW44_009457 [Caligus rogercresseyi]|uniref:Uncharacterized protein n=1 Tax=Caligus rogercresseyi TaxID=217165 RepID=A0A7T8HFL8_CALRO|nr:Hypothetical protein FKW44_009457 [Caligus rogercresseyi]